MAMRMRIMLSIRSESDMTKQVIFTVEQRSEYCFAVLGPNPDAGKEGVCYAGANLTICTTDGAEDAALIACALNLHAASTKVSRRRAPKTAIAA
jgi:hypothetical protein